MSIEKPASFSHQHTESWKDREMAYLHASAVRGKAPKHPAQLLSSFATELKQGDVIAALADDLIGKNANIDGPFGPKPLVYADYFASGRALMQVERFILDQVLPYYANSHTEASFCGSFITRLRREARDVISASCDAGAQHAVIFTGSGATAALNRLSTLFGVGPDTLVLIGPYEHHSNILPWRESGAEVVEIPEGPEGGPDLESLADVLNGADERRSVVCAFSAASNVTGIITDVAAVTRLVKTAGARMIWDYAGGGPYLPITMTPEPNAEIDAIVISPHKFIGGPGASGVLIVRRDAVISTKPTWPGGGTVRFVSPTTHDYSTSLQAREEAGTPNIVGDIRAAIAFLVKGAIGTETMQRRNKHLTDRVIAAWSRTERLELLGSLTAPRLPVFAFRIQDGKGGYIHQQLITRILSDRFGIQTRGGCACAGPYVHRLFDIDNAKSDKLRRAILAGDEIAKPGFTRLNFSVLLSEEKVAFILDSVIRLAANASQEAQYYDFDRSSAIFSPRPSGPIRPGG